MSNIKLTVQPQLWTPAQEWAGHPVVIVGTGPSLTLQQVRAIGLGRKADRCRVIALKDSVLLCWWADVLFAADAKYWARRHGWQRFPGRRVGMADSPNNAAYQLSLLQRSGFEGFESRPGFVRTHRNSGAIAVQLAAQLTDRAIVLAGFDMQAGDGGRHWFGENEWGEPKLGMEKWPELFRSIADALPGRIKTLTPNSALDYLPVVEVSEVLG